MDEIRTLCDQVRQTAYDIHCYHACGHLEKVYETRLFIAFASLVSTLNNSVRSMYSTKMVHS